MGKLTAKSIAISMDKLTGNNNRILITAVNSGSGKTAFTCGLLNLLKKKSSVTVASHKCGPDYIDPMFHRKVLGIPGTNLDPFFSDGSDLCKSIAQDNAGITVIEGAMGIYDGISGMGKTGSCYEVAVKTKTPVILLVDAKGTGNTIISVIKGILADDDEHLIKGIVFNRMSKSYLEVLKTDLVSVIKKTGQDIVILGAVPKSKELNFESRHLGLVMPDETQGILEQINSFSKLIEENVDIDAMLAIAETAGPLPYPADLQTEHFKNKNVKEILINTPDQFADNNIIESTDLNDNNNSYPFEDHKTEPERIPIIISEKEALSIGIARDDAFCFYYEQNIRAFKERGVDVRTFSPLKDKKLPEGISGILLGGGYPELFLKELSENEEMRTEIKNAIASGMPSLAECGGFMYLGEYIEDENGIKYPMAGVIRGGSSNKGNLTRFGYVNVSPKKDGLLKQPIRGHEFHYFDHEDSGSDCLAEKPGSKRSWDCMYMGDNHLWGYPHLYYPSQPGFVDAFVEQMKMFFAEHSH